MIQQRLDKLRARRESLIDERRGRLADKLFLEDQALKNELVSSKETPEQRRAKLATRARELAATREAERQKIAVELYQRAFEENCDVLRETNSKRILYRTLDERNAQVRMMLGQGGVYVCVRACVCVCVYACVWSRASSLRARGGLRGAQTHSASWRGGGACMVVVGPARASDGDLTVVALCVCLCVCTAD